MAKHIIVRVFYNPVLAGCPEDPSEMAEAHYFGRLEPNAAGQFTAHIESCSRCRQEREDTELFITSFRAAAARL